MLCIMILTPSIFAAALVPIRGDYVVSVETTHNVKAMTVLGSDLVSNEYIRIERWSNGSTNVTIGEHFYIGQEGCPRDLWVNMTQMIPPQDETTQQTRETTKTVQPCAGQLQKQWWDDKLMLLPGNNGTHIVKYFQDDNFDTYFGGQWYKPWNLSGARNQHIHLAAQDVTNWLNGVTDTATMLGIIFMGLAGALTITAGVAEIFDCPWAAVPAIIGGMASIVAAIAEYVYHWQLARYIRDVVQTWYGDGFTWIGAVLSNLVMHWYDPFETRATTVYEYWEERLWGQEWGAELGKIVNPPQPWQYYTISWYSYQRVKGAGSCTFR